MHSKQISVVQYDFQKDSLESSDIGTWLYVTNEPMRRFITDELLSESHDKVVRTEQSNLEDETIISEGSQRPPDCAATCSEMMTSSTTTRRAC